jgi:GTP cyclohydrolase I
VSLRAEHTPEGLRLDLGVKVTYSSTCPCSAALARQLIQRQFDEDFGEGPVDAAAVRRWLGTEQGILATPHSQRSVADVTVRLARPEGALPVRELVDRLEEVLQTPVQTAVKREDEQEFALRNGRNLMFCEDAARRLKTALDADARFADFRVRVDHYESLHAHDATAVATKGVPNGFPPVA